MDTLETIILIYFVAFSSGCVDGSLVEMDPREGIHSSFTLLTSNVFHLVECSGDQMCFVLKTIEDVIAFLLVLVYCLLTTSILQTRWVNHQISQYLSHSISPFENILYFLKLSQNIRLEVEEFTVATSEATFSNDAFGTRVERDSLGHIVGELTFQDDFPD